MGFGSSGGEFGNTAGSKLTPTKKKIVKRTQTSPSKPKVQEKPTKEEIVELLKSLPQNPDDLSKQGWTETTHPHAPANQNRTFVHDKTGIKIRYDYAKPGHPGHGGQNHYHAVNPDKTGKNDEYLDINGNPVRAHSNPSHLYPLNTTD